MTSLYPNVRGIGAEVFTTGQISKLCRVAPRTVAKWFDAGRIKGYRIPGSNDRRVVRKDLLAFFQEHGMPVPPEIDEPSCLLCGLDATAANALTAALGAVGVRATALPSLFELGTMVCSRPRVVVLDLILGRAECVAAAMSMATLPKSVRPAAVALLPEDLSPAQVPPAAGFSAALNHPVDPAKLAAAVLKLAGVANA